MNVLLSPSPRVAANSSQIQQRSDDHSSAVIDRGIIVQSSFNTICAIEYLKSHNVDPHVIERVLLHPEQRRKQPH